MARVLGASELGIFYAATSLAAVAGIAAAQGYPQIAPRFAARYRNKATPALFGRFAGQATLDAIFASAVALVLIAAYAMLWPSLSAIERSSYVAGGVMVVAVALINIYTNIAGAMRFFGICYVPEGLGRPILFFSAIAGISLLGLRPTAFVATALFAGATALIAVYVIAAMRVRMPPLIWRPGWRGIARRWRREAWLLVLLAVFTNFFADIGILVAVPFLPSAEVAVFGLCLKLALLVGYFVQIAQQMAVPDIADARHAGDSLALRRALWRSIAMPFALTAAALAGAVVLGRELLSMFGPQFAEGRWVLIILIGSQLMRALAGPSSHLMTLRGVQGINALISTGCILVLILASLVFTGLYGLIGAGLAVFVTFLAWLGATAFMLHRLGEQRVDILALLPDPMARRKPA